MWILLYFLWWLVEKDKTIFNRKLFLWKICVRVYVNSQTIWGLFVRCIVMVEYNAANLIIIYWIFQQTICGYIPLQKNVGLVILVISLLSFVVFWCGQILVVGDNIDEMRICLWEVLVIIFRNESEDVYKIPLYLHAVVRNMVLVDFYFMFGGNTENKIWNLKMPKAAKAKKKIEKPVKCAHFLKKKSEIIKF